MVKNCFFIVIVSIMFCSCGNTVPYENPLNHVLKSQNPKIKKVMDSVAPYEVQILYSEIERKNGEIHFQDYEYNVNAQNYFYPASTVKFPIAIFALGKLNQIDTLDMHTRFYVQGDTIETTFAQEIAKIFAVSDNTAYNRLFEFLGQDLIDQKFKTMGMHAPRISHRLSVPNADEITTKPLIVYLNDSTTAILANTINTSATGLELGGIEKGVAYYDDDTLINEAFDFSLKNYYPLPSQHHFIKTVLFPEAFERNKKLGLTNKQLGFIRNAMRTLPKNAGYDPLTYYDGYCKFFIYGDTKENIPEHVKIYNKVGDAYGTLTDCAYIQDTKNQVEFLLTATILVNKNKTFNDDVYEYDEIGLPFLAELGRELYTYKLNHKK